MLALLEVGWGAGPLAARVQCDWRQRLVACTGSHTRTASYLLCSIVWSIGMLLLPAPHLTTHALPAAPACPAPLLPCRRSARSCRAFGTPI